MTDFRPVRPFGEWPVLEAQPFDTRSSTFLPDLSVDNAKIRSVSPTKLDLIGAKVYNSATQSIASDTSYHSLTFDTEDFDQGDLWTSGAATKLVLPYSGVYAISGYAAFETDTSNLRRLRFYLNGATQILNTIEAALTGAETTLSLSLTHRFAAGDYLELQARQDSTTGALNIQAGADDNYFAAVFLGSI